MEEVAKKRTAFEKEAAKFFRDGKNTVPVYTIDKFRGHLKGAFHVVHVATGSAESAFTAKGYKFKLAAMRAAIKSPTVRGIPAIDHLIHVFDNRRSGMEFINDMFIIISKNGL